MELVFKNLQYHREKDKIPVTSPELGVFLADRFKALLANEGVSCELEINVQDE